MTKRSIIACLFLCLAVVCVGRAQAQASRGPSPAAQCRRIVDDDTVRPYSPALDKPLRAAFARLFPGAEAPTAAELRDQSNVRCMGGRLYACFVGANLPCAKMNTSRRNAGAEIYCRANPNSSIVPMVATGHDAVYAYRCRNGRAVVTGANYKLDRRGFATRLWAPLD